MKAALLLVAALGLPESTEVRERARALYAEDSSLCADEALSLDSREHALYCPVAEHAPRCRALAEACARGPRSGAERGGGRAGASEAEGDEEQRGSRDGDAEGDARDGAAGRADVRRALREQRQRQGDATRDGAPAPGEGEPEQPRPDDDEDRKLEPPLWLRQLASFAFYAAIAALLLVVARMLWRHFASARDEAPPTPDDDAAPAAEPRPAEVARVLETDVERLLARARARAASGDHRGAIEDVYAALLRRLEGAGLVELHPSKTNGDYLERLRTRQELRRELVAVVREVERVQFGDEPVGASRSSRFFELTRPFFERALAVALLVLCLGALEGCEAFEQRPRRPSVTQASGHEALLALLDDAGVQAAHRTRPLDELGETGTLLVLPGVELDERARLELEGFAERGGQVVYVGGPSRARVGVAARGVDSSSTLLELRDAARARLGAHRPIVAPRWALDAEPSERDVLRRDGLPYAVELARGDAGGRVVLFADEALFSNLGLAIADNAAFTVRYLASLGEGPVELVDDRTGLGAASPLEAVRRAELLPILLQLLFVFGLYVAWKGAPFGRPRELSSGARRAYLEHAIALGALYRRARAAPHAAGLVSSYALDRLRERVASPEHRGLVDLAERVAARTKRPLGEVVEVLERAHGARAELAEATLASRLPRDRLDARRARPSGDDEREAQRLLRELDAYLELDARGEPPARASIEATHPAPPSSTRSPRVTEDSR